MATQTQGNRKTFKAGADLSAGQYLIVKLSADNTVILATAATEREIVGTLNNAPKANDGADVSLRSGGGTALVKAGGTIARGDSLTTDSAGKAVATTTANDEVIGKALQAGVANDVIEYMPANGRFAIS